ncbi:MAG: hypothetical protein EB020_14545 [Proteobacteria bacterium]|nr:hypothetical protein [Pseudomonadota bacterium]
MELVLDRYVGLRGVDFANITDSALAKMKLSGLVFGALFKQRYGIEPVVQSAGPLLAILLILVTPLIWSVPTALMVAELSS